MILTLAMLTAAAPPKPVRPDGKRVTPVDQCFTIELAGKPVGATRQIVRASWSWGKPVWDIVVHQRMPARSFDLRDHFVLRRADLLPLAFDNQKSGVNHVRLSYSGGQITGTKTTDGKTEAIDVAAVGPVWEGNLWGVAFGALPLAKGASFELPFYQYDQGLGHFTLHVTGDEAIDVPNGRAQVWTVDAGVDPSRRLTYLIDKRTGEELGSRAAGFETRLGGDCSGLD